MTEEGDDGAIQQAWQGGLTDTEVLTEVAEVWQLLIGAEIADRLGEPYGPALVHLAEALRDAPHLPLGHLPIVRKVLGLP